MECHRIEVIMLSVANYLLLRWMSLFSVPLCRESKHLSLRYTYAV